MDFGVPRRQVQKEAYSLETHFPTNKSHNHIEKIDIIGYLKSYKITSGQDRASHSGLTAKLISILSDQ